ncbi:hypothetical protein HK097_001499 [Rhizophlyctis rosea]|uniref:Uncharacterized protein n=1 Tax=Rhizophlyctis rosea TaxID=64517 RepID=A0AAD5X535_9FUNG|nr:hypothetical protein HK097_001499 [Rhizophlyctis rosea]
MAGKSQSFVKAQLEENAAVVEHWVMALLVARLEVLSEYLKVAGAAATPYQFAIMQLVPAYVLPHNSELPSDRAVGDDALVQLTAILRHAKVEDLRQRARDCLRSFRRADGGRALPVVVDEVQVLLEESTKRYAATTDSAQERPLYTPVIGTILSLNPMNVESILPVVVSGTGLSITEAEEKSGSMVGKGVASTVRVICRSGQNFKAFRKYLQLFVDLDDSAGDEQVKGWWSRIYSMLRGRPRFAAVFVELCIRVLSGSPGGVGSLGALLAKVWETLLRSDSDKSVYAAVHRLRTRNRPDLWQFAVDVCASYLYSGCPVVFFREKHLQLVEMGLAQLQTGVGSQSLEGRIDEPLVAWAMFQYCRDHDMHLAERVFHWMGLQKSNPSSSGFLWESVLPEELFKLFNNDRPMKEHPLFAHLGSRLPPYFNYPAVIHRPNLVGPIAVKASDTYRLANFLANPLAPFFLPEFRAGPDIAFAIDFQTKPPTTIACFLQAKLAVKVGDKRAAKLTTCPERFYSRKGETGLVPEREDVIQALLERYNRAQGVVRIMLAFPTALDSTNYSTSSHPTTRMTRSQAMASPAYPDVEIIVDVNNIAQFATKEHVAFLENLKGGEFEHSISEVGVGFEVDEEEEEEGGFGMEIDW